MRRKKGSRVTQETIDALKALLSAGITVKVASEVVKVSPGTAWLIKKSGYSLEKYDELARRQNTVKEKITASPQTQKQNGVRQVNIEDATDREILVAIFRSVKRLEAAVFQPTVSPKQ